jgi:hypothetical protein
MMQPIFDRLDRLEEEVRLLRPVEDIVRKMISESHCDKDAFGVPYKHWIIPSSHRAVVQKCIEKIDNLKFKFVKLEEK